MKHIASGQLHTGMSNPTRPRDGRNLLNWRWLPQLPSASKDSDIEILGSLWFDQQTQLGLLPRNGVLSAEFHWRTPFAGGDRYWYVICDPRCKWEMMVQHVFEKLLNDGCRQSIGLGCITKLDLKLTTRFLCIGPPALKTYLWLDLFMMWIVSWLHRHDIF